MHEGFLPGASFSRIAAVKKFRRIVMRRYTWNRRQEYMSVRVSELINRPIRCSCGKTHFCGIHCIIVEAGALKRLPSLVSEYHHILVAADNNTWPLCGGRVSVLLGARLEKQLVFQREGMLVPNEDAVRELEDALTPHTDLIIGIGSGVINDLCKYVSFRHGLDYAVIATAPSMDGYASSGAAMIMRGMKVTYTTRPPRMIIADTDILCAAPMDMIRSGYGDIIGKYSSLNDWQLSRLINGEYLCPEICRLVMDTTDEIRGSAPRLVRREPEAVAQLTNALILIGITLSLVRTTRPGSGSEHHLSHYFEITGLIRGEPHFLHGTDVGYSTVVTARMRQRITALSVPEFRPLTEAQREAAWDRIYGSYAGEVRSLQRHSGFYETDWQQRYRMHWDDICTLLQSCPSPEQTERMLTDVGFEKDAFVRLYGERKIRDGMFFGKDLKERFSVLWPYYELFSGELNDA